MRLINTRAHALFDYLLSITLTFSPWLFDFAGESRAAYLCALCCAATISLLTAITQLEYSVKRFVSLRAHLTTDLVIGTFLTLSPWLFQFHQLVFKPHFILGLALITVSLCSDRVLTWQAFTLLGKARRRGPQATQVKKLIRLPEEEDKPFLQN